MPISTGSLRIVEIHDTDVDHEVGGQDLPLLVSVVFTGAFERASVFLAGLVGLGAFNIRPATRHPGADRLEFLTFEARSVVERIFGFGSEATVPVLFALNASLKTVGDLRAAIKDLPDNFPIIKTYRAENVAGVSVLTNVWRWKDTAEGFEKEGLALRLE